jgi:hypothetical protein
MNIVSYKLACEQTSIRSIGTFCGQFKVGAALKSSHAYKTKGIPVLTVVKYLMCLVFTGKSMFRICAAKNQLRQVFQGHVYVWWIQTESMADISSEGGRGRSDLYPASDFGGTAVRVRDWWLNVPRLYGEKVELCGSVSTMPRKAEIQPDSRCSRLLSRWLFTDPLCFPPSHLKWKELVSRKKAPTLIVRSCGGQAPERALES